MTDVAKPECKLIAEDGNVFAVIGTASRTLKEGGQREQAKEFTERAFKCTSYNGMLTLLSDYVRLSDGDRVDTISNEALRVADVPDITAHWPEIAEFALTFDGYEYAGSLEACRALADWIRSEWRELHQLPAHLSELRAALFYEQRRARWTQTDPSGADLRFCRALVAAIAVLVKGEPQ